MIPRILGFRYLLVIFFFYLLLDCAIASTCGYEACSTGNPNMLNVHIIMHTHDDVGWIHTVDSYYDMWVRDIITSVISALMQNENRKFIYVESAFFTKWWNEQPGLTKEFVRRLVNDGRLEFISGGWSMNDEATTQYLAIIDQMTLGLRWLNETFGVCGRSKIGWQIDPFGHSREQASLFAQMGFDGLFLGRIHYQDKKYRESTKTMEFVWKASESLDDKANIFTGILPNVYWPPKGFCFDSFCSDEELTEDNINYKAHTFIALAQEQAALYATNHIVMTMGMDFHFRDAAKWFRNMDFLISHVNSLQAVGMKVNMFYSTPTCYLKSLHQQNFTWTSMQSEFFPYASGRNEYWTGYFTSRPALKYQSRKANSFLQVCKQLSSFANIQNEDLILPLKRAVAVLQHHDGITGTEKQHVAQDYSKMLADGYRLCEDAAAKATRFLLSNDTVLPRIHFCEYLNMSKCGFTEREQQFLVIAFNPLSHPVKSFARLPVVHEGFLIRQFNKRRRTVPAQVVPIPPSVISLPERSSQAVNELIFPISMPPHGFSTYGVKVLTDYEPVIDIESERLPFTIQDAIIQNEFFQVVIDGHSGLLKEIVLQDGRQVPMKQSFYFYEGMPGYRMERASGAYAFNPQRDTAYPLAENITYRVFKGPLVEEIHQFYTPWISQVIKLYKGQKHVEFDWVVGPIPTQDNIGREVITKFDTDMENRGVFYTDSNGRETMKRVRDHQDTFPWNITEKIAGNYYPVTSWIYMRDEPADLQLSLLPDRAEGGSSVKDGSLELMLHRRLLYDDGYGVDEALNEPGYDGRGLVVRGSYFLTLGPILESTPAIKRLAKRRFYEPLLSFSKIPFTNISRYALKDFRGLKRRLPHNVNILTLERLDDYRILVRLEHFYERTDEPDRTVSVSFNNLFRPFRVVYYQETTLSAHKFLYEDERLKWLVNDHEVSEMVSPPMATTSRKALMAASENNDDGDTIVNDSEDDDLRILLKPMEIRTFILKIERYSTS